MAGESKRWQIINTVKEVLEDITISNGYKTDVAYVSDELDLTGPKQGDMDRYPGCYPIDLDEEITPWEVGIGTAASLRSDLQLTVVCMIYERKGSDLLLARTNLIRDVNAAITQDAALTALLIERPTLNAVLTQGYESENYSTWQQVFTCSYLFLESEGG